MKHALTLVFLLAAAPAFAATATNEDVILKDYIGLTKVMRSQGIEPTRVHWGPIEMMCLGLKTASSQVEYNRCRLAKAQDQIVYNDDSADCDNVAFATYPRSLSAPRPAIAVHNTNTSSGTGKSTISTYLDPKIRTADVVAGRRATYSTCMRDRGWVNPRNWQMGRY